MITKFAAFAVLVIAVIHFAGWVAGIAPEPEQSAVVEVQP